MTLRSRATAHALDGALPEAEREQRRARFMAVQAEISRARLVGKVGSTQRVLVDEVSAEGSAVGRTAADAPEIDRVVHLKKPARGKPALKAGEFVTVRVTRSDGHDLFGVVPLPAATSFRSAAGLIQVVRALAPVLVCPAAATGIAG